MKLTPKELEQYKKLDVPKPIEIGKREITEEQKKKVEEYIKKHSSR